MNALPVVRADCEQQLATCFENVFPSNLDGAPMRCERSSNGERVFFHLSWVLPEGDPIAFLRIQYSPQVRQVWIGALAVCADYRGRGFGKQIVRAIERGSSRQNVEAIRLFTRHDAEGFWKAMGYRPEENSRYLRKSLSASNDRSPST